MKDSVRMAREALQDRRNKTSKLLKEYEEQWYKALEKHLMEKYGTTDPTLNMITGSKRHKYAGRDDKNLPVYVQVPYYTCMCPDVKVEMTATEYRRTYKVDIGPVEKDEVLTLYRTAVESGKHITDCPFNKIKVEEFHGKEREARSA